MSSFFYQTELFAHVVNDAAIEFPAEEDWPLEPNSKDLITALLQQSPQDRLGSAGPQEVKEHPYLAELDWNSLLRYKVIIIYKLLFTICFSFRVLSRPNSFHVWQTKKIRAISIRVPIATTMNSMIPIPMILRCYLRSKEWFTLDLIHVFINDYFS